MSRPSAKPKHGQAPAATAIPAAGAVKRETVYLVALVMLALGFVAGVVFTAWRTERDTPPPGAAMPPGGAAAPAPADQEARIKELQARTAAHPDDVAAWTELGNRFFDADRSQEAIVAYERSLALDPSRADVWTDLGVMYRHAGNPRKAVELFDKAVVLEPTHEIARFNKGIVLLHDLNDREGALASWEELLRVNPLAVTPGGQSVDELVRHWRQQAAPKAGG
jgi:cytochrome c-type biogenesis protein CcmH/NrfG